jgi:hypothetical protein
MRSLAVDRASLVKPASRRLAHNWRKAAANHACRLIGSEPKLVAAPV